MPALREGMDGVVEKPAAHKAEAITAYLVQLGVSSHREF